MHVIGTRQRRGMFHPLLHGADPAHHAEGIPIGNPVLETIGLKGVVQFREQGPGHEVAVHTFAHVSRPDEQEFRLRRDLSEIVELTHDTADIRRDAFPGGNSRHGVSSELHEDETGPDPLKRFAHHGRLNGGEDVAGGAAERDVVHRYPARTVQQNAVDFRIAVEVNRASFHGRKQFPRNQGHLRPSGIKHLDPSIQGVTLQGKGETGAILSEQDGNPGNFPGEGLGIPAPRPPERKGTCAPDGCKLGKRAIPFVRSFIRQGISYHGVAGQIPGETLDHGIGRNPLDHRHHPGP